MSLFRTTLLALFFAVIAAKSSECLAVASITVNSGNIIRADPITQMSVSISVTNVDPTDMVNGDIMQTIYTRLAIYLSSYTNYSTIRVKYQDEPASTSTPTTATTTTGLPSTTTASPLTLQGFSIGFSDTPQVLQNGTLVNVTLDMVITDANNPPVLPSILVSRQRTDGTNYQVIPISVNYTSMQTSPAAVAYDVELVTAVANEDPSGLVLTPTHKSIGVTWTQLGTITYNDSIMRAPSGVIVYIVDLSKHLKMQLDGTVYNADENQQTVESGSCTFAASADFSSCSLTCPKGQFLTDFGDTIPAGVQTFSEDITTNSINVGDLDPEKYYGIFARYQPDSVGSSVSCLTAKPLINYSMTEMNNSKLDAKEGNPACFVATAAYGSPLHRNLHYLRWFRDKILLHSNAGRRFVHAYYQFGPKLAAIIATKPSLRLVTRALLWPLVTTIILCKEATPDILVVFLASLYMLTALLVHRVGRAQLARMGVFRYLQRATKTEVT